MQKEENIYERLINPLIMKKIDKEELKSLRSRTKVVLMVRLFLLVFLAGIALAKK